MWAAARKHRITATILLRLGAARAHRCCMTTYGTCECSKCYKCIPKNEAHQVTIERETGHSVGHYARTYYSKRDVWLCDSCYAAYLFSRADKERQDRIMRGRIGIGILAGFIVVALGSGVIPAFVAQPKVPASINQQTPESGEIVRVQ